MGVLTATLFYIDKKPQGDERKRIERCLEKKNCAAAFYDCSYYLFLHKKGDEPDLIFYCEIIRELRKEYTTYEEDRTRMRTRFENHVGSWFLRGIMSSLARTIEIPQTMTDQEFMTTTKEVYEIKIEVIARNEVKIAKDFKILKIREFSFNQICQSKRNLSKTYRELSVNYRTLSEKFLLLSKEEETCRKLLDNIAKKELIIEKIEKLSEEYRILSEEDQFFNEEEHYTQLSEKNRKLNEKYQRISESLVVNEKGLGKIPELARKKPETKSDTSSIAKVKNETLSKKSQELSQKYQRLSEKYRLLSHENRNLSYEDRNLSDEYRNLWDEEHVLWKRIWTTERSRDLREKVLFNDEYRKLREAYRMSRAIITVSSV